MSRSKLAVFAPKWLRCLACTLAMLPLIGIVTILAAGRGSIYVVCALLPCTVIFQNGLNILITGYPCNSSFSFAGDLVRSLSRAKHTN